MNTKYKSDIKMVMLIVVVIYVDLLFNRCYLLVTVSHNSARKSYYQSNDNHCPNDQKKNPRFFFGKQKRMSPNKIANSTLR